MKKLILIDANALIHRAFHALPPLTSPKGIVTNAVFGFSSILIKMLKELKPDYIAAAFDLAGPTFRHEQFEEYKAHREKAPDELYNQIPIVKDILKAFGVPIYEKQGYEADDLIGSLVAQAQKNSPTGGLQTIIATGDLDALQLVEDKEIMVFTLRKGISDTAVYDEEAVRERYGFGPKQMNDYKGLKGDPSDNIPGVPGVGEKTASDLIKQFGNLENLYEFLDKLQITNHNLQTNTDTKPKIPKQTEKNIISPKLAEKLLENKEKAFFSRQLATIVTDLDTDFSLEKANWRRNIDQAKIETIFRDLGFSSLIKRLSELETLKKVAEPPRDLATKTGKADLLNIRISDFGKLEFDPDKNNFYATDTGEKTIAEILKNPNAFIIGHNLKPLYKAAIYNGNHLLNQAFDTKIAAYLLNPDLHGYDFSKVYYAEFGQLTSEDIKQKPAYLWKLKEQLWDKLKTAKLTKVFEDIEMPLIPVLAEMELNGIKVDIRVLIDLLKSVNKELAALEKKIHKLGGGEFNINSPQQLGDVLYNRLQIRGRVRRTGGGALSTAAPELEKLREAHPIIDLILQYRELQKLKTTYIKPFPELVDPKDGRIHTTYNQTGTGTGRLSSENPNLQNVPIKTELGQEFRQAFIAEDGYQLVSFDYSQIELRIVAHIAKDKKMITAFKNGLDIHTATAAEVFEVPIEKVTSEMRRQAKALNFGIIYGMGSVGFARSVGVTTQRAREFITQYFSDFSGIADYMEKTKAKAHNTGYVETIFGRRRQILDIHSAMPRVQAQAERMAINHPIQGTAADLIKLAMVKIHQFLHFPQGIPQETPLPRDALDNGVPCKLLLQVHDELVFEIKTDLVKKLAPQIKEIMESVYKLDVPIVVDVKHGQNWKDMEPMG